MDPTKLAALMKRFPCKELETGNIRTCPVRLSFPSVFERTSFENGEPKYSTVLLFPKGADVKLLIEAAKHTAVEGFGSKAGSMGLHMPFRDQGIKSLDGYEAGAVFMTVTSKQRPGVLGPNGKPITDEEQIYPGCWALVTVRPFHFDAKMKKGVSFGLQNLQKIADDDSFAGTVDAEQEFEPLDASLTGEDAFANAGNGKSNALDPFNLG